MDTPIIPQKQCTRCKKYFDATLENFYKQNKGKFGLTPTCKFCRKIVTKQYKIDNAEKVKEQYANNYKNNKSTIDAKNKKRNQEHPEYSKKASKNYRERHPDRCYNSNKEWLIRNPEKKREYTGLRRWRLNNSEGRYTREDIKLKLETQKGVCWWCGCELNGSYEIDHIIPVSRGGSNWPNNICLSCRKCNRSKSNKLPHEWRNRLP